MSAISHFLRARLSPEGHLGLHLTVGAVLLVLASALFGAIAEDVVTAQAITILDVHVAQWLHAHGTSAMTRFMLLVTYVHGIGGIAVLATAFGIYLARQKAYYWLLSLVLAVAGGAALNVAMKYAFHRARPSFDDPLMTLATYSFPSGHTAGSTTFYGVLACYLFSRFQTWPARLTIVMAAVGMTALVGMSRMYLGVHYLSDVLGAVAEACAWLALIITAVSTLRRRQVHPTASMMASPHA